MAVMTRFLHTMVRVTDPEKSRAFYEALGFAFSREMDTVRNGAIYRVTPSAFLYWVRVTATAGANTFVITQTITTGNFTGKFVETSCHFILSRSGLCQMKNLLLMAPDPNYA